MLLDHPAFTGAFLVLLAWMCLATVLRSCVVPRVAPRGGACGRCGYAYSGWTRCPECGGDVAEVGVATPSLALRLRASRAASLVGILFLALALTHGLSLAAKSVCTANGWQRMSRGVQFSPMASDAPSYGMTIHWDVVAARNTVRGGTITLTLNGAAPMTALAASPLPAAGAFVAVMDARDGSFEVRDANGGVVERGNAFEPRHALAMLDMSGVPLDQPTREQLAREIIFFMAPEHALAPMIPPASARPVVFGGSTAVASDWSLPFPLFGAMGHLPAQMLAAVIAVVVSLVAGLVILHRRRAAVRRAECASASRGVP